MTGDIPFEIQMEIIERVPDTKSVIRCRSVSKAWKSVIDSKEFVKAHTLRCTHQVNRHHLLIKILDWNNSEDGRPLFRPLLKYFSIVDDDTFPHQKLSVFVPDSVNKLSYDLIGTSYGLFCLYEPGKDTAIIWNPSIRKAVATKPNVLRERYYRSVVRFGVCPGVLDPKIVKITYCSDLSKLQDGNASPQVEVLTLSSGGTWRSSLSSNRPHKSIRFGSSQAVIDGVIYWDAVDRIHEDDGTRNPKLIMSFDLTTEEFTKINLPDHLQLNDPYNTPLPLYKLRESLVVIAYDSEFNTEFNRRNFSFHVWMMIGHGCTRSFTKLYSINPPDASILNTLGFRKSGVPIIDVGIDGEPTLNALAIYEPASTSITNIGIPGINGCFLVHSYMETLLLLDY